MVGDSVTCVDDGYSVVDSNLTTTVMDRRQSTSFYKQAEERYATTVRGTCVPFVFLLLLAGGFF
jgi:hypothetical protein